MSDLNDKELFEQAISSEPVAEAPETPAEQPTPEAEASGQLRDEHGRFAAQQTEPAQQQPDPQAQPQGQTTDKEAHVPSWRLREVNEAKEAAERRAREVEDRYTAIERQFASMQQQWQQAQQKPAEPVDPWQDLPGYLKQSEMTLEQRVIAAEQKANLRASRAEQIATHGRQAVDEMEKAIGEAMRAGNPELGHLRMQMQNSDDPVGVAMQWYQRDKLVRETGGDVAAYRNKLSEELLKDPAFLAKALEVARAQASGQAPGAKPTTLVQLPPSINRQASAASPHEETGDLSDRSLYAFATR